MSSSVGDKLALYSDLFRARTDVYALRWENNVAMLPSLARRDDVAELTSGYGQVVVDEGHHLAADAYEHSVKRIGAQFWLGLTATPTRRDGLGEIVTWQLGPIRHTMTQDDQGLLTVDWARDSGPQRLLYVVRSAAERRRANASAPCGRQKEFGDQFDIVWCDIATTGGTDPTERLLVTADKPEVYVNRDVGGD
jgi:hypothetical protein